MKQIQHSGRTDNVKRNISYGIMHTAVSLVLPFIVRSILIYRFGVDYLGINSVFASVLEVLSVMELGFGTAIVYNMYKPVAAGDTGQICAYLSYYRRIYRIIGLMILAAGLIIIPFLKVLVKDSELPGSLNLYACYLIFLFNSVVSYLLYGYMNSLPLAFQRRDILSRVDMSMAVLKCIMESMVLISSDNFYLYLLSMPLITILRNLLTATVTRRLYPDITCRGKLHKEQIVDLHKRVYGLFLNKLTVNSRNGIDTICISAFISLAAAGIYSNYYIIMAGLISVSIMICQSMMASVGNSIVTESRDKNYTNMRSFDFIYMTVAGWATVCLICLYQPFISLWLGDGMKLGLNVVLGLCLYFYILKAGDIRWVFHEGVGLWYECRFITIGETIANLVLNILLCSVWGIAGIVYATVITVFVTNMLLFPEILFRIYFRNGKLREYWTDHLKYFFTTVVGAVPAYLLCSGLDRVTVLITDHDVNAVVGGISLLVLKLLICTASFTMVFLSIWRRSGRYKNAVQWIRRLTAKT